MGGPLSLERGLAYFEVEARINVSGLGFRGLQVQDLGWVR